MVPNNITIQKERTGTLQSCVNRYLPLMNREAGNNCLWFLWHLTLRRPWSGNSYMYGNCLYLYFSDHYATETKQCQGHAPPCYKYMQGQTRVNSVVWEETFWISLFFLTLEYFYFISLSHLDLAHFYFTHKLILNYLTNCQI